MRKKKILMCSEATFLHTGYATYTREVMNYLHETGKYELAEMAAYGQRNDPRGLSLPWKYYGVQPNREFEPHSPEEEIKAYDSNPIGQFGGFLFEHVCLDFKPDIVFDIRDFWQLEFAERSPFRDFFHWVIMPTVDAYPQARQWVDSYTNADAVFTYSTWAGDILKKQSGGKINYKGVAPPSANPIYKPLSKDHCREELGLPKDINIVGTVMRNQRRKLFPDLFKTFSEFLSNVSDPNKYKLYCHTCYPDLGWDIPELLLHYGLSAHVYFTYKCPDTDKTFASLFAGAICESPFTGKFNATMCNVRNGASYEQLAQIMNCFDLYVQYANSEGFGMCQAEAAACGVPVAAIDYSAMSSVIRELNGKPLKVKGFYKELETGCNRAVPDNAHLLEYLEEFFSMPLEERKRLGELAIEGFNTNFTQKQTCDSLMACFDELPIRPEEMTWKSPPKFHTPQPKPDKLPENITHKTLVQWLIVNVLGDSTKLNSHFESRMMRDIMYGTRTASTGGLYFNESSAAFDGKMSRTPFNFHIAYDEMNKICDLRNHWEQKRMESI